MSNQQPINSRDPPRLQCYLKEIETIPTHQFIEYSTQGIGSNGASPYNGSLRVMLKFAIDPSEDIFDSLFEILPRYAKYTTTIYIGMIFQHEDENDFTRNDARRRIMAKVVEHLNDKFSLIEKLHFAFHLHYFLLDHIGTASAIYGLTFQEWTLAILTDDVLHAEHNSFIDRYLRRQYSADVNNMRI